MFIITFLLLFVVPYEAVISFSLPRDDLVLPQGMIKAVNYDGFSDAALTSNDTITELSQIVSIGAEFVFGGIMLCQDNITSNEVYWGDDYPSLESVATFINLCHQVGLKVVLKPLIVTVYDDDSFYNIEPSDTTAWFASYTSILTQLVTLNLDGLIIGTELRHLTYPEDLASQWVTMISQLRGAALPSTPILSYATLPIEEWRQVQFWSSLDWIGIDAWYSIGTSDNPYPSLEEMQKILSLHYSSITRWFNSSSELSGIPIVFEECGYASNDAALVMPQFEATNCSDGIHNPNQQIQSDAYTSLFSVLQKFYPSVSGISVFWWDNQSTRDYCGSVLCNTSSKVTKKTSSWACGWTPRGKTAFDVLTEAFGGNVETLYL